MYNAQLSAGERRVFERLHRIIADFAPRTAVSRSSVADWLIYTDASASPPWICALRFDGKSRPPALNTLCASRVPTVWLYLFRYTFFIYGMELLDLAAYFEDHALSMRDS